jgi:hypothetical protein
MPEFLKNKYFLKENPLKIANFGEISTLLKENFLKMPELDYEDFLFKPKKFEFFVSQTKCNLVRHNVI